MFRVLVTCTLILLTIWSFVVTAELVQLRDEVTLLLAEQSMVNQAQNELIHVSLTHQAAMAAAIIHTGR